MRPRSGCNLKLRNGNFLGVKVPWKVNLKNGSLTQGTVYPNISIALLHDAIHGRKSEASSLSHTFGGKERLEDMRNGLRTHAGPRVFDRKHYITSLLRTCMFPRIHLLPFS